MPEGAAALCQVGPWGPCSAPCGVGVRNRTVACLDAMGGAMPAGHCPARMPADELQCNVLPCDICSHTSCAGQARPGAEPARARLSRQPLRLVCAQSLLVQYESCCRDVSLC